MGIEKLNIETVSVSLEKIMKSSHLFFNYKLISKSIQKIKSPTINTEYDFTFTLDDKNRMIFVRIKDYFKYQELIIWLINISDKSTDKIDLKNYFISKLRIKNIEQRMVFKSKSELELINCIQNILNNRNYS